MEFPHSLLFNFSSKVAWSYVLMRFILTANYNAMLSPLFSKAILFDFVRQCVIPERMFLSVYALTPGTKQMTH